MSVRTNAIPRLEPDIGAGWLVSEKAYIMAEKAKDTKQPEEDD